MSHRASHWLAEIPAAELSASQFRVLFHLCDAHNSKRAPESACFPSQERLRDATGLSNGGLNNALHALESGGFIRRIRRRNADGTLGPTFYILGCDFGEAQGPTPPGGDGSNSISGPPPSPVSGPHHLHSGGDEPVKKPGKEPARGRARASKARRPAAECATLPGLGGGGEGGDPGGAEPPAAARARPWGSAENGAGASGGRLAMLADWINSGKPVPPSAVSNTQRDELVDRGLVTRDRLRELQIY